jgi:hypothetical protein
VPYAHHVTLKKDIRRFDRGELKSPERLPNGWVKFDGYIARSGILEYRRADGSTWREYRPPEENAAAVKTFDSVPLTNDHPREGLLTAENTREFQVGTVSNPQEDGEKVRASVLCTDAATIADIEGGKAELSCGYVCGSGVHRGQDADRGALRREAGERARQPRRRGVDRSRRPRGPASIGQRRC